MILHRCLTAAFFLAAAALGSAAANAQSSGGGPINIDVRDRASEQIAAIHPLMVRRAAELGIPVAENAQRAAATQFQYPLQLSQNAGGFVDLAISNYTDRNTAGGQIRDFACGSRTYDGHNGTDIFLTPYSWNVMDRNEVRVVAALPGVIVDRHDGEFDRQCSLTGSPPANYVIIRHDNGLLAYYWHLKRGTVTTKVAGARVAVGEALGFVGSSGFSSGPHLHFEVHTAGNAVVDPFAGQCNVVLTRWTHQARTNDPGIVRIATHSKQPPSGSNCDNPVPGYATRFSRGQTVWFVAYLRDQLPSTTANIALLRPNGSVATSFTTDAPPSGIWAASYWYSSYTIPADGLIGEWRVRVTFGGTTQYDSFVVQGTALPLATITAAVASPVRTVTAGTAADFTVTLENTTANRAIGCRLSLSRPINADVTFRRLDGGVPTGFPNYGITIGPDATVQARLTVKPRTGFKANAAEFQVVAKCTNSATALFSRLTTLLTLTSS